MVSRTGKLRTGKLLISYRREDSLAVAGRLDESLGAYFGEGRVFRDTANIEAGADFANVLDETVGSADAVIVLIGAKWLNATDANGQRRLDDPDDWVAREIASALNKNLPVFPVLIEGTPMPRAEDRPELLKALVRYNAASISDSLSLLDLQGCVSKGARNRHHTRPSQLRSRFPTRRTRSRRILGRSSPPQSGMTNRVAARQNSSRFRTCPWLPVRSSVLNPRHRTGSPRSHPIDLNAAVPYCGWLWRDKVCE